MSCKYQKDKPLSTSQAKLTNIMDPLNMNKSGKEIIEFKYNIKWWNNRCHTNNKYNSKNT
jgi:hypothetical protein